MLIADMIAYLLSVWAMAWLLVEGVGLYAFLARMRRWLGVRIAENSDRYAVTQLGELFNCEKCISVWIAFPLLVVYWIIPSFTYCMAAVGFVILIMEFINAKD